MNPALVAAAEVARNALYANTLRRLTIANGPTAGLFFFLFLFPFLFFILFCNETWQFFFNPLSPNTRPSCVMREMVAIDAAACARDKHRGDLKRIRQRATYCTLDVCIVSLDQRCAGNIVGFF